MTNPPQPPQIDIPWETLTKFDPPLVFNGEVEIVATYPSVLTADQVWHVIHAVMLGRAVARGVTRGLRDSFHGHTRENRRWRHERMTHGKHTRRARKG